MATASNNPTPKQTVILFPLDLPCIHIQLSRSFKSRRPLARNFQQFGSGLKVRHEAWTRLLMISVVGNGKKQAKMKCCRDSDSRRKMRQVGPVDHPASTRGGGKRQERPLLSTENLVFPSPPSREIRQTKRCFNGNLEGGIKSIASPLRLRDIGSKRLVWDVVWYAYSGRGGDTCTQHTACFTSCLSILTPVRDQSRMEQ